MGSFEKFQVAQPGKRLGGGWRAEMETKLKKKEGTGMLHGGV